MIPALLDPHLDPTDSLEFPPDGTPPAARARCRDVSRLDATARNWLDDADRAGLHVLTPSSPDYPDALREAPLRPLVLFVRGDVTLLATSKAALTVVGSRTPTAYGRGAARDFCDTLAAAGVSLWSGLAAGIDAAAHESCVRRDVPTVAVLAGGLDRIYPAAHRGLADRIVARGGACVSELPPGMPPQRGHFPRRNRILALASGGVLVIEAGLASGSLHTARFAADAGTSVWALPGPYTSERSRGCHRLLADGALIAADPESLLRELGVACARDADDDLDRANGLALSADAESILRTLAAGPRPTEFVRRECGLEPDRFLAALLDLRDSRRAIELPGDLLAATAGTAPRGSTSTRR